jgi:hypothetical protein
MTSYQAGAEGGEYIYPHIDKRWPEIGGMVKICLSPGPDGSKIAPDGKESD